MYFWHSLLQRFSVSVLDKKSGCDSKSSAHDKLPAPAAAPGGISLTGGRDAESRSRDSGLTSSVKKEPLDHHRDRGQHPVAGRYSPPDYVGLGHHATVPPVPGYHGYHVDKTLLPPSLSGPHAHSVDIHGQKFDFFRGQNSESETGRGLQSHGLC